MLQQILYGHTFSRKKLLRNTIYVRLYKIYDDMLHTAKNVHIQGKKNKRKKKKNTPAIILCP